MSCLPYVAPITDQDASAILATIFSREVMRPPAATPRFSKQAMLLPSISGRKKLPKDLVDLVAELFIALKSDHVGKTSALGDFEQRASLAGILVRNILHKEKSKDVVLVLRRVHAAA